MPGGSDDESTGGGNSRIQTFLRIRPSQNPSGYFSVDDIDPKVMRFQLPKGVTTLNANDGNGGAAPDEYVNNSRTAFGFKFDGVLGPRASQDEVFNSVGRAAVNNVLEGFNSTVFAYGQTGSGKTFTITGGPERYSDRGLIPRAIQMLFNEFNKRTDVQFQMHISYLELYNEQGYDLLDPGHDTKALTDLPRVNMQDDEFGNCHISNLSMHLASAEEDALNLLFLGDTNRAIAETPMNDASSRSHCIFTIAVEARTVGSDRIRRSKLNLVDLAGSERVKKTRTEGQTLTEAKYINSSLFFLEMVIVALREKAVRGRTHVPYRNSRMTMVLKDSLGGNCKTVMVATINPEAAQTEESVSTCRFAQRVAQIKNTAFVNENVDPSIVIRRLKAELANLREEISFLKGEAGEGDPLSDEARDELREKVDEYINDRDPRATLDMGPMALQRIRECQYIFKTLVIEARRNGGGGGGGGPPPVRSVQDENRDFETEIANLRATLQQRNQEISILVNMVKQGKAPPSASGSSRSATPTAVSSGALSGYAHQTQPSHAQSHSQAQPQAQLQHAGSARVAQPLQSQQPPAHQPRMQPEVAEHKEPLAATASDSAVAGDRGRQSRATGAGGGVAGLVAEVPPPADPSILEDMQQAFQYFRAHCSLNEAIEENKQVLKRKYAHAKATGEQTNQSRSKIHFYKESIEQIRREKAMRGTLNGGGKDGAGDGKGGDGDMDNGDEEDDEEAQLIRQIEHEQATYKQLYQQLRECKSEVEQIQRVLERGRAKLQVQFDTWHNALMGQRQQLARQQHRHQPSQQPVAAAAMPPMQAVQQQQMQMPPAAAAAMAESKQHTVAPAGQGGSRMADKDVDEDIEAFYRMRDSLRARQAQEGRNGVAGAK